MTKSRTWFTTSTAIASIASLASIACARPVAISREFSAADTVANVEAWIKTHPKDAAGYCALGRVHALAWAYGDKIPLVRAGDPASLPSFSEASTVLMSRTAPPEYVDRGRESASWISDRKDRPITANEAAHLAASIAAYRKAIELNPNDALSELGLGWMLAQQGLYARDLPADFWPDPKPTDVEKISWSKAIGQLADEDPKLREAATQTLLAAMPRCVRFLHDIKSDDPESEVRIAAILRGHFELQALDHYRRAFTLRAQEDLKGAPTYQADSQISARAGAQILTILSAHPQAARDGEAKSVQDVLDPLAKKMTELMSMPQ